MTKERKREKIIDNISDDSKFYILNGFAFCMHFMWIFLFLYEKVYFLSVIDIISSLIYLCLFRQIAKGNYSGTLLACSAEVVVHSIIAVICFGVSGGFDLYILVLVPILFFFSITYDEIQFLLCSSGIIAGIIYIALKLYLCFNHPFYSFTSIYIEVGVTAMNGVNILLLFSILAYLILMEGKQINRKLEAKNRALEFMSNHDYLTRLLNRRSLKEITMKAMNDNRKQDKKFAIAFLDIDNFKKFNDEYGHDFGDAVLVRVSEIVLKNAKEVAKVCRWGGEELVLFFYPCEIEEVKRVVDAIREEISNENLAHGDTHVHVTVTCGIAFGTRNVDKVIAKADRLMLQGKENGKNCVVSEF